MNNKYITQLNTKKTWHRKGGYNPKYAYKKNQNYRKGASWILCKQRLTNVRGLYLKHVYTNLHRVIIYKYMHVILVWWYILSYRYLQLLHQVHHIIVWCEYFIFTANPDQYAAPTKVICNKSGMINTYRWALASAKNKKRGLYLRKRVRRGGFFRIRRNPVSYSRYLPPKQYALVKAFYSPPSVEGWEDKFTLPLNISKIRRIITQPRGGFERKRYVFINFTAFTVRARSKSYLYYTNLK